MRHWCSAGWFMPVLELKALVRASPELVWQVISDMDGFSRVAPNLVRVEVVREPGQNLRRRLFDVQGRVWNEEQIAIVPGRSLTMRVDAHYFSSAFSSMHYTWSIRSEGDFSTILMRYNYLVKWGYPGALLDRFGFGPKLRSACQQILDNWVQLIHAREWAWRVTAQRILDRKGGAVITVPASADLAFAAGLLATHKVGCMPALDAAGGLVGMLSERDVVRAIAETSSVALTTKVSDVMTQRVIRAAPDDSMELIMNRMNDHRVRHLPVLMGSELLGVISIGDVVNARIAELEGKSSQLRDFIETRRFNDLYRQIGPAA
jgi:CBS domain-containing protein/ribosome-associated toxin RatA of RatAB toxin-antitoxin module